jgi:hypothetical protein
MRKEWQAKEHGWRMPNSPGYASLLQGGVHKQPVDVNGFFPAAGARPQTSIRGKLTQQKRINNDKTQCF